uniref:7TM GPCR serpentine receptor class x (Srx) domain-containing protein n=1 Tax=Acrobeloides nanus TaxID=290746 RepID=A0A914EJ17_9BILA
MLLHLMYIGVCLARGECLGGDLVNTVLMKLAVYSCYMCMLLNLFVAWNRFAAVFFYLKYDKLFNRRMFIFYYASALILSAIANIPGWKYGMKFVSRCCQKIIFGDLKAEYLA